VCEDEGILQVTPGVEVPLIKGCITAGVGQEWGKARARQGGEAAT